MSMCSEDELVALIPFPNLASSCVTGKFKISGKALRVCVERMS